MSESAKADCARAAQGVGREAIDGFLLHAVQEARRVCQDFRITLLFPLIGAADAALHDSGVLDVAVVGRFKAGKSSLLNLLIGRDILPVAVLPMAVVPVVTSNVENVRWATYQSIDETVRQFGSALDRRLADTTAAPHGPVRAARDARSDQNGTGGERCCLNS
jgi:predicted GTPase